MKHYGDITKLNGADLPPVDIITGGSPCQDLSVAGKRAGLAGERSGLFMEQIRVIKEMRDASRRANQPIRPRYMVWENVPGAFSRYSNDEYISIPTQYCGACERKGLYIRLMPKDFKRIFGADIVERANEEYNDVTDNNVGEKEAKNGM